MDREIGNKSFPIWLLGDSNPPQSQDKLNSPLDARHPIRHNIWTSVLDVIQDRVYRERRLRVSTNDIYIRNAVDDPDFRPDKKILAWSENVNSEIAKFAQLLNENQPRLILSFGAFAYEFGRRAHCEEPAKIVDYWRTKQLGDEFRRKVDVFNPGEINLFPLLHRSVAGGYYLSSHKAFCPSENANYFEFVGEKIAGLLLKFQGELPIWI